MALGAVAAGAGRVGELLKLPPTWQASQVAVAAYGMWFEGLPAVPLKDAVPWHRSQDAVVAGWLLLLPLARSPSWQLAQLPGSTETWLKITPAKPFIVWQSSQACVVCTCRTGMAGAPRVLFWAWQVAQSRGVPLKMPRWWQVSQRTSSCLPRNV
jgi:hypothetical protein